MPTKKRKYEARFPPARIKKIMQTDEEIGKVAAAVPVIISRALEIFLQQLVEKSAEQTHAKRAKTMTTGHLKQCIESENQFDFLKDLVANIADMPNQEDDDNGESGETKPKKARRPRSTTGEKKKTSKKRSKSSSSNDTDEEENPSDNNEETTTIFPRASSDLPGSSHQSEATSTREPATTQVPSSSTSNSYDLPNQSNPFNSSNLQRMPMMLKPQHDDDDDDEDYDQDD